MPPIPTTLAAQSVEIAIDRGGTFTDVFYKTTSDQGKVFKILSLNPSRYSDSIYEAIRQVYQRLTGKDVIGSTEWIRHVRVGTTAATNALLERKGQKFALVVTKGFKDLLKIGTQARPNIFQLDIPDAAVLYDSVIEVEERLVFPNHEQTKDSVVGYNSDQLVQSPSTGEFLAIDLPLNMARVASDLRNLPENVKGLAICLTHSYLYPNHEEQVEDIARQFSHLSQISRSSAVLPMKRMVQRAQSTCVDAYLTPVVKEYAHAFVSRLGGDVNVQFMQSDGGLASLKRFSGLRAILSGPAGGVVGYARTQWDATHPVIGFDMGGTSTDVSRYGGCLTHSYENMLDGIFLQIPQLEIDTVAAGGGSKLWIDHGMFKVGPASAGAFPGPTCYRNGGPLTVTDANLICGRIDPEYFPKIFGKNGDQPLDELGTRQKFKDLIEEHQASVGHLSVEQVAYGFLTIANETMRSKVLQITQTKGFDVKTHVLSCFGGAGAQHACGLAKGMGMGMVVIHKYASVLSAYGLALADLVHEDQEPCQKVLAAETYVSTIAPRLSQMGQNAFSKLDGPEHLKHVEYFLHLRYATAEGSVMISGNIDTDDHDTLEKKFLEDHEREYGFILNDREIVVDDIRVRAVLRQQVPDTSKSIYECVESRRGTTKTTTKANPAKYRTAYFEMENGEPKIVDTAVYVVGDLEVGDVIAGPALIIDPNSTLVVEFGCRAVITEEAVVFLIDHSGGPVAGVQAGTMDGPDPIQLAVMANRYMAIAEDMGRTLQKTSLSTNIKERLDFSCAIFDSEGGLVANAPHIPVHLGSMQEAVRYQLKHHQNHLKPGNVVMTNHPAAGGSHLPDITTITPVYEGERILFFVASRGHHADIGGISPGSMPPRSRYLHEEGAAFKSLPLVVDGVFQEEAVRNVLVNEPAQYEGSSGTRNLRDNMSDLKAQVAANNRGIQLLQSLIDECGSEMILRYMTFIQQTAADAVRTLIKSTLHKGQGSVLHASDFMDDGTEIRLKVTLSDDGNAVFDFCGTGEQVLGNTNAPPSVAYSAIIYCLRCMVHSDIPLNQGCLNPITVIIPDGCLLKPSEDAAVVGGNVMTSQRIVDTIFKAFGACAASQGDCNNLTFGGEGWGYYETIAGGAGAGPSWAGRSGVHVHMTNTRITDPEILEQRYPVILRSFSLRPGSGGSGRNRGGDGVIRHLEFRAPIQVSILSERRVHSPYGMKGGENGQKGRNLWKKYGKDIWWSLGGKNSLKVGLGDEVKIETPGGGGYGTA